MYVRLFQRNACIYNIIFISHNKLDMAYVQYARTQARMLPARFLASAPSLFNSAAYLPLRSPTVLHLKDRHSERDIPVSQRS